MWLIIKHLYKNYREVINYIIVGGLTTIVSLESYYICVLAFLNPYSPFQLQIANIISWFCAVVFAYVMNRKFVFESRDNCVAEIIKFAGTRIITLFIDMICMALFVTVLEINDKLSKLIVQFVVFTLNYIFTKFIVFRK